MLRKFLRNLRGVIVFAGNTVNTIFWFIPIFLLALVKLVIPIKRVRNVITGWLMAMGEYWISINAWIFSLANETTWDVRGVDQFDKQSWYLVIANHQSWVDILALQTAFNRRIPFLKFFIKQELIWFPFLGIAWWAMDMPFMKRYSKSYLVAHPEKKGKDLESTRKACEKFRDVPTSVINFIEGTRFTEEKRIKRDSPYRHLLPPRAGGVALAVATMGEMFDAVIDVTIVYPRGTVEFWAMACGELEHIIIDVRRRPIEDWMIGGNYAEDREYRRRFHQWLGQVWQEKDARMAELSDGK